MCSMIDSGEKGYKLPEQILFNSLVLYLTLNRSFGYIVVIDNDKNCKNSQYIE